MERPGQLRESPLPDKANQAKLTREMLFLAEQAAEGRLKVLPAAEWSLHYPADAVTRAEKLQGLLDGKYKAGDVAGDLKPDALLYKTEDISTQGLEKVRGRIRDLSEFITHYDFKRFAEFVESMRGHKIQLSDLDNLYSDITRSRVQKKVMDSYGQTGRQQIEGALRQEAEGALENTATDSRLNKVLKTLKVNWLCEDMGLVGTEERDRAVSGLSGDERDIFNQLQSSYRDYVKSGDEAGYKKLVDTVREGFPLIQKEVNSGEPSESMKELEKELEEYKDKAVPPGSPEDQAIPPEDEDEYHTPPPSPSGGESAEKTLAQSIFEINPALGGYYASGRKSYYDIKTRIWSKKKQLTPYDLTPSLDGDSFAISGAIDTGLRALPIPVGHALDISSIKFKGSKPDILRDQNGCFYLNSQGAGSFSIAFCKEKSPLINSPIPEDVSQMYKGQLSQKTESAISRFVGTPIQKAEQVRQYILANHFYPGGGDLKIAQALQYKLRTESTEDNYLQNIDNSEYLECYSANTNFIAIMRRLGVPARLVIGHKVEGSKKGKSAITQSTGHAWSEIWDGTAWRRFDATPNPKPEDQKKNENTEKSDQEEAEQADDGGVENSQKKGEKGKAGDAKGEADSGNPLDEMSDASDSEMNESESELQDAKEEMQKMTAQKNELNDRAEKAEKFKELSELQEEIKNSELFEDFKKELEDKLEAKVDQMKDKIKDELDKMVEDGFMDEKRRDEILENLEKERLEELDQLQQEVENENRLYNAYEDIREEVTPLVDKWFNYFAERLPRQEDVSFDEDSLTRQGAFDRRAVMKSRNLLFGTVKNPREIIPSIKPRFMASVLVDVSGSMAGDKLLNARKLLIFYSELFSRISSAFGYIRFSINTFSDSVTDIKDFDQEYDSAQRYNFHDGMSATIKVRLMEGLNTKGGTNMLDGIKKAAAALNRQVEEYPDYASAFYFVGDGGDTCGNAANIASFLKINQSERGFGEHMYSAILLGDERQRKELANIFGDEHTNVAPDFDELIERSMDKFDEDLSEYLKTKTQE